jgi:hypothetical protein
MSYQGDRSMSMEGLTVQPSQHRPQWIIPFLPIIPHLSLTDLPSPPHLYLPSVSGCVAGSASQQVRSVDQQYGEIRYRAEGCVFLPSHRCKYGAIPVRGVQ